MANEYLNAFNEFNNSIEELELNNTGGNGVANSAQEYYDLDEAGAEESWSNFLDSEGLEIIISLEDCLNGDDLAFVLENEAHDSYVNGQFSQFKKQYASLCPVEFETYIEQTLTESDQLKICKYIILNCF